MRKRSGKVGKWESGKVEGWKEERKGEEEEEEERKNHLVNASTSFSMKVASANPLDINFLIATCV